TITTVVGTGTNGYSGDGGPASAAELNYPSGVAVDAAGDLYISDTGNERIRKVDTSTGLISTIVGTGTAGYSGDGGRATAAKIDSPQGLTVDSGNLYFSDTNNNRIREVQGWSGNILTVAGTGVAGSGGDGGDATLAQLNHPVDVAGGSGPHIYIAD